MRIATKRVLNRSFHYFPQVNSAYAQGKFWGDPGVSATGAAYAGREVFLCQSRHCNVAVRQDTAANGATWIRVRRLPPHGTLRDVVRHAQVTRLERMVDQVKWLAGLLARQPLLHDQDPVAGLLEEDDTTRVLEGAQGFR